jgi:hypothetical protein
MMVLVDTPVWSLALRRKPHHLNPREQALTLAFTELVSEGRAHIAGVIRQEVLSGIRDAEQFEKIRLHLRGFDEPNLQIADYEEAASMDNHCRSRGVATSAIDLLICAVAHRRNWQIFTTDQDFVRYGRVLGLKLYAVA